MRTRRKILVLIVGSVLGLTTLVSVVRAYQVGETMPVATAEKRWGKTPFESDKFKVASPDDRAKMIVDLIQKKSFYGKPSREVYDSLGRPDGHFFSDSIPAYLLNEGWKTKTDTWQVVFLLDGKSEKVSEVIIHKNCCD